MVPYAAGATAFRLEDEWRWKHIPLLRICVFSRHTLSDCHLMRRLLSFVLLVSLVASASAQSSGFHACGDLSYLDDLEAVGARFYDNGVQKNGMSVLKDHGMNMVRLRIWHTPTNGRDGLQATLLMAKRIQAANLDFLLDFHYSDYWADPGKQYKPAAWEGLNFSSLRDSVRVYSSKVVQALVDQGTPPDIVQIGNETTTGMLWNEGRVGGSYDNTSQWGRFASLTKAGIEGVREAGGSDVQIMIHIDRGGDAAGVRWFFDNLTAFNVEFDLIGLSYYPFWHGDLSKLEAALQTATTRYKKPVMLAEIAYPWTLQWYDSQNNFVGSANQLISGYPATPQGQRAMIEAIVQRVQSLPDGMGVGVCYWAPELWAISQYPSAWENLALFDNNGQVLPAADALNPNFNVATEPDDVPASGTFQLYPNPVRSGQALQWAAEAGQALLAVVTDVLGRNVFTSPLSGRSGTLPVQSLAPGFYWMQVFSGNGVPVESRLFIVVP